MKLDSVVDQAARLLGFPEVKEKQREAMTTFLSGRDVFISVPTGYGKSLCYAALPIAFDILLKRDSSKKSERSIVIVISPLLALMQDQVASFSSKGLDVACVTKDTTEDERSKVQKGCYQVVFFSPESLLCGARARWISMLHEDPYYSRVVAFTIDEAHCVKKWGDGFRLEYRNLQQIRSVLSPDVHIMALTATATKTVRNEIAVSLGMKNMAVVYVSPDKSNMKYVVIKFDTMERTFGSMADQVAVQQESLCRTIIFCQTVSDCCLLYRLFRYKLGDKFTVPNGSEDKCRNRIVDMFHSDTEPCIKEEIIRNFCTLSHHLRLVIATVAFGMGVDVPDIRTIVHFGACDMYVQAVGRAGRDGKHATAVLLARKGGRQHISEQMDHYIDNTSICRRALLFAEYEAAGQSSSRKVNNRMCVCCDVCQKQCKCGNCSEEMSDSILRGLH